MIEAYPSASLGVSLYNAGSKKLQTNVGGITVTGGGNFSGIVTASSFSGIATGATKVYVDESEDDSNFYNITFLDSTGTGNQHHTLQVDHLNFAYNPAANALLVNRITPSSGAP